MASAEKALLKAAIADEMAAELLQAVVNAEKNGIATAASRDTMERLFARVAGYKTRIDEAFEEGKFPEAASDPVYAVFKDLILIVQDSHRTLVQVAAEQAPFTAGLRKAHSMAVERAGRERSVAARATELELLEQQEAEKEKPPVPEAPVDPQIEEAAALAKKPARARRSRAGNT
jgi:hypothetical protein